MRSAGTQIRAVDDLDSSAACDLQFFLNAETLRCQQGCRGGKRGNNERQQVQSAVTWWCAPNHRRDSIRIEFAAKREAHGRGRHDRGKRFDGGKTHLSIRAVSSWRPDSRRRRSKTPASGRFAGNVVQKTPPGIYSRFQKGRPVLQSNSNWPPRLSPARASPCRPVRSSNCVPASASVSALPECQRTCPLADLQQRLSAAHGDLELGSDMAESSGRSPGPPTQVAQRVPAEYRDRCCRRST